MSPLDVISTKGVIVHRRTVVAGLAAALVALGGSAAFASEASHHGPPTAGFTQVNQVSDLPGKANITDPDLVNAWGLSLSPTSPLWSANNGTNTATLYSGAIGGAPAAKVALTVTIPGGAPTGTIFNDTTGFVVSGNGTAPASFIFSSEGGDITAWNRNVSGTVASVKAHVDGAVFKSLALAHTPSGPFLLAADFVGGQIDVFDSNFNQVTLPAGAFEDPQLPSGYAPFDVMVNGDSIFVTYAKHGEGADEAHGPGLGFVDEYTNFGQTVHRIASHGTLNAPWGLAIAPAGFGDLAGSLLVGNFGDGRINVFTNGEFAGQLRDTNNRRITIDGLWALLPGTASTGGVGTLWFSAGPDDESHGLVGQLVSGS